jgi:CheY-like chemotaxis protein
VSAAPILLVEDDADHAAIFGHVWKGAFPKTPIQGVSDGQEAVDYLAGRGPFRDRAKHPVPFVVVLDLKLPKLSGLDVLAWMRGQTAFQALPAVLLSSSQEASDMTRAAALGANHYFAKPVGLSGLRQIVLQIGAFQRL